MVTNYFKQKQNNIYLYKEVDLEDILLSKISNDI